MFFKNIKLWQIGFLGLSLLYFGCGDSSEQNNTKAESENNVLSETEISDGWILLFDGKTFNGWHGLGQEQIPTTHWVIEEGAIKRVAKEDVPVLADGNPAPGGDIITDQAWRDFEFTFDWKVSSGSNSGVKYNVSEELSTSRGSGRSALGWEYQVIDDAGYPGELRPNQRTGGLYDMFGTSDSKVKPVGEWNSSKIVFVGNHGEHWLNGKMILAYDMESDLFKETFENSKFFKIPGFIDKKSGHIVLQDHGNSVWYRNLKLKPVSQ